MSMRPRRRSRRTHRRTARSAATAPRTSSAAPRPRLPGTRRAGPRRAQSPRWPEARPSCGGEASRNPVGADRTATEPAMFDAVMRPAGARGARRRGRRGTTTPSRPRSPRTPRRPGRSEATAAHTRSASSRTTCPAGPPVARRRASANRPRRPGAPHSSAAPARRAPWHACGRLPTRRRWSRGTCRRSVDPMSATSVVYDQEVAPAISRHASPVVSHRSHWAAVAIGGAPPQRPGWPAIVLPTTGRSAAADSNGGAKFAGGARSGPIADERANLVVPSGFQAVTAMRIVAWWSSFRAKYVGAVAARDRDAHFARGIAPLPLVPEQKELAGWCSDIPPPPPGAFRRARRRRSPEARR